MACSGYTRFFDDSASRPRLHRPADFIPMGRERDSEHLAVRVTCFYRRPAVDSGSEFVLPGWLGRRSLGRPEYLRYEKQGRPMPLAAA